VADCRPANNKTKSFTYLIGSNGSKCTPGGSGVPWWRWWNGVGGDGGKNGRRRRAASLGFGGLLLVRLLLVLRKL